MQRLIFLVLAFILLSAGAFASPPPAKIVVSQSESWPPFSFTNAKGEPRGLLIDLWQEFGRRNGVEVEFKLTNWSNSLEQLKTGHADVHGGLFESPQRDEFLDFSKQMQVPLTSRLFVSNKLKVTGLWDIGNVGIGLTAKGRAHEYILNGYPDVRIKPYPNSKEVVEAAMRGEVLAFVTDYPAAMYFLHKGNQPDQFHVVQTLYTKKLQAAVAEGNVQTLNFITEGFKNVPQEDFDRITQKWIRSVSMTPEWLYPLVTATIILIVVAFAVLYVFALQRQVRERTHELEVTSQTDRLTSLNNRQRIEEILETELYRLSRYGHPLGIILLDIDKFKDINDTYGHHSGDEVLIAFSELIKSNIRQSDFIGRWGGEEFLIVCPQQTEDDASALAMKLKKLIERHKFPVVHRCTASFGVTNIAPGEDAQSAFIRVDSALYESKREGRNTVTFVPRP